jgi:putative spermidine/putrescine transport system ATP-binding protein
MIGAGMKAHALHLKGITHRFSDVTAVADVTLDIAPGEFVALLGPSGCGKTTLLRSIVGFVVPDRGAVIIDDQDVTREPPNLRNVGIVFQSYALFPHLSVEDNIAYGLNVRRIARRTVRDRVAEMLALVRMADKGRRYPRELSGGQQQRVALARVLAVQPRILLLDEPLSALDRGLRMDMQIEIKRLQRELGITTILVTHDQEEAMSMADRIAVMNRGRVHQFDRPMKIYDAPADMFVNGFVGSTNLLPGIVVEQQHDMLSIRLDCGPLVRVQSERPLEMHARAVVSVRPERLDVAENTGHDTITGRVAIAMPLGASTLYEVKLTSGQVLKLSLARAGGPALEEGSSVHLRFSSSRAASVFPENG